MANNLSNSQELIIFQVDAKTYFENLVFMKGGLNKLNKLEQQLIKLNQCRNTHLQWEVMSTFCNNLIKPIFMRLKDSKKIISVLQSKQLVKEIDMYIMALTRNPESLIQGCILLIYDADIYVKYLHLPIFESDWERKHHGSLSRMDKRITSKRSSQIAGVV